MITREKFIECLRDALTHLYHADYLRNSPLVRLFGLSDQFDASSALRKILTDGIEALKPAPDQPEASRAWRIYDSLFCCYVQQLSHQIVADQLCISDRQLRREQRAALEELADLLWREYLSGRQGFNPDTQNTDVVIDRELSWVRRSCADVAAQLKTQLSEVLNLCNLLSTQNRVDVRVQYLGPIPDLLIHPVALNQILLNVILYVIHHISGGVLEITAWQENEGVIVTFHGKPPYKRPLQEESENPGNLDVAMQIANLSRAKLEVHDAPPLGISAVLLLPACEEIPVLVIDDNSDAHQLMRRFTSGSRFKIVPVQDPNEVFSLVESEKPRLILLDIMMPQDNGWMVLARLKQHPLTMNCPVIICSVLPQETLAMTLGASGYLKKPFTREAFLQVLEQQIFGMESEPDLFA